MLHDARPKESCPAHLRECLAHRSSRGVFLYCSTRTRIGARMMCGVNAFIWDAEFNPLDPVARSAELPNAIACAPVKIGDDVFVRANSAILNGVSIGPRAVIGAGSIVASDVPRDEVWAGKPVRFLRRLESAAAATDVGSTTLA